MSEHRFRDTLAPGPRPVRPGDTYWDRGAQCYRLVTGVHRDGHLAKRIERPGPEPVMTLAGMPEVTIDGDVVDSGGAA